MLIINDQKLNIWILSSYVYAYKLLLNSLSYLLWLELVLLQILRCIYDRMHSMTKEINEEHPE